MKHAHTHKAFLTAALSVLVFVAAVYGFMYLRIHTMLSRSVDLRQQVRLEESYRHEGENVVAVYDQTKSDRAKLDEFFVSDKDTVSFIELIESLGDRVGSAVSISSIDADNLEGKDPGTVGLIKVRVEVRGSWSAVMRTVSLAESLPYHSFVSNLRLDTQSTEGTKREWRSMFTISATLARYTDLVIP